ncbi:hypothetical protein Pmani_013192 [Petrolisthes manimaculis]|uniref:Uncharacterized protein n=1 Tax=Petrolisthes manimaculis TaxID=1843537 RepID=A0AAE1PWZ8_9EUCA|nr:hypothetical protein Pmani_013192 [Petrolisthes manimaculis]
MDGGRKGRPPAKAILTRDITSPGSLSISPRRDFDVTTTRPRPDPAQPYPTVYIYCGLCPTLPSGCHYTYTVGRVQQEVFQG